VYLSIADDVGYSTVRATLAATRRTALIGAGGGENTFTSFMTVEEGSQRFREVTAIPPATRLDLSASRAVLAPRGGFAWRFVGSRHRARCDPAALLQCLEGLRPLEPVVALQWRHVDIKRATAYGIPIRALGVTLTMLIEDSSIDGWQRALGRLARARRRIRMYGVQVGPTGLIVAVAIIRYHGADIIAYGPVTESTLRRLQPYVRGEEGRSLNATWIAEPKGLRLSQTGRENLVLVCEHLVRKGF
jgi:hypothetical protein